MLTHRDRISVKNKLSILTVKSKKKFRETPSGNLRKHLPSKANGCLICRKNALKYNKNIIKCFAVVKFCNLLKWMIS